MRRKNWKAHLEQKREYYRRNRDKILRQQYIKYWQDPLHDHAKKIVKRYGLTREQYQDLLIRQNNGCAICKRPRGKRRLAVDHNHVTSRVRGLLCTRCNRMLADAKDSIELLRAGIVYLEYDMALGTGASSLPDEKELE